MVACVKKRQRNSIYNSCSVKTTCEDKYLRWLGIARLWVVETNLLKACAVPMIYHILNLVLWRWRAANFGHIQSFHHFKKSFSHRFVVLSVCKAPCTVCQVSESTHKCPSDGTKNPIYIGALKGKGFWKHPSWCNMRVRKKEQNIGKSVEHRDYSAPGGGWRKILQWQ